MGVVTRWVKDNKKPITSRKIVEDMCKENSNEPAILVALRRLAKKGYLSKTQYKPYAYVLLKTAPITYIKKI